VDLLRFQSGNLELGQGQQKHGSDDDGDAKQLKRVGEEGCPQPVDEAGRAGQHRHGHEEAPAPGHGPRARDGDLVPLAVALAHATVALLPRTGRKHRAPDGGDAEQQERVGDEGRTRGAGEAVAAARRRYGYDEVPAPGHHRIGEGGDLVLVAAADADLGAALVRPHTLQRPGQERRAPGGGDAEQQDRVGGAGRPGPVEEAGAEGHHRRGYEEVAEPQQPGRAPRVKDGDGLVADVAAAAAPHGAVRRMHRLHRLRSGGGEERNRWVDAGAVGIAPLIGWIDARGVENPNRGREGATNTAGMMIRGKGKVGWGTG
jgi:hypothetical protein